VDFLRERRRTSQEIGGVISAGILFGLAVIRRGRIGDAVVAHATANALLAAYVLAYHKWHLW
jgi:membrane protease YdiL (CAAX protease family)